MKTATDGISPGADGLAALALIKMLLEILQKKQLLSDEEIDIILNCAEVEVDPDNKTDMSGRIANATRTEHAVSTRRRNGTIVSQGPLTCSESSPCSFGLMRSISSRCDSPTWMFFVRSKYSRSCFRTACPIFFSRQYRFSESMRFLKMALSGLRLPITSQKDATI